MDYKQRCSMLAFLVALGLGTAPAALAQYDCAGQNEVAQQDCEALIALYQATTVTGPWDHDAGFWQAVDGDPNNDLPLSQWATRDPVEIENGRVAHVNLWGNNLNGTLPDAICDLEALRELDLDFNRLTGTIPTCIGQMAALEKLSIRQIGFDLEGTLPEGLGNLANLKELNIPGHTFTGPIPASLGTLANLEILILGGTAGSAGNQLDGSIPASLGQLTKLTILNLRGNRLTGSIPESLGNLATLTTLEVSSNDLSGSIPASLGALPLETLGLAGNELTDFEEGSYAAWTGLQIIRLNDNALANLPDLSGVSAPARFNVSYNHLTFGDLDPFAGLVGQPSFEYEPQRPIPLRQTTENGDIVLHHDAGGGDATTYEWRHRGPGGSGVFEIIEGATSASYVVTESGEYVAHARNPAFPDLTVTGSSVDVDTCTGDWLPREDLNANLPSSIRVFENCMIPAWLVRADPSTGEWSFKTASSSSTTSSDEPSFSKKTVSSFAQSSNAFVAINGGFFGGNPAESTSLVASGGSLLVANKDIISRDFVDFRPTRATFGMLANGGIMDFKWTYNVVNDDGSRTLYAYPQPALNAPLMPAATPSHESPQNGVVWILNEGIGGGPMLVYNGAVVVNTSWEHEVFFGGKGLDDKGKVVDISPPIGHVGTRDPRTAMGMTATGELLFVVADGRCGDGSKPTAATNNLCADGSTPRSGISHQEMAALMVELGAQKAMNLDGGGSSTLVVTNRVVNKPSDGKERSVASAIVLAPISTASAAVFDSGDDCCYAEEGVWLEDTEATSSGSTPARLNEVGTGSDRAVWRFPNIMPGSYEIAAWWTPAPNRAINTPYTIFQQGIGKTTTSIRVDQSDPATANRWNTLGTFDLAPGDSVVVTDDAIGNESPSYVVVDAIRLTAVTRTETEGDHIIPDAFHLAPNYPNPFNPETVIPFTLPQPARVRLTIYDVLGRAVAVLVDETLSVGTYQARFDAGRLASGVYVYRLTADHFSQTRTMVLLR